jgi:hypothetical protein
MGNDMLGEQHEDMLALFRSLGPRMRRIVMRRPVEILEEATDLKAAILSSRST